MAQSNPHNEDGDSSELTLQQVCHKLDRLRVDFHRLRRDLIGDDADSVQKSVLARLVSAEARIVAIEQRSERGQSRWSKFTDNILGQLIIAIVVFIAGTMVWVKQLPSDSAAKLHSIQTQAK